MKAYLTALLCATMIISVVPSAFFLSPSSKISIVSEESVKGAREDGSGYIDGIDGYEIGSPSNSEVNSFVDHVSNIIKSLFRMLGSMLKGFFNAFKDGIS